MPSLTINCRLFIASSQKYIDYVHVYMYVESYITIILLITVSVIIHDFSGKDLSSMYVFILNGWLDECASQSFIVRLHHYLLSQNMQYKRINLLFVSVLY